MFYIGFPNSPFMNYDRNLIFVLHGYGGKPLQYASVKQAILECYPNSDVHIPQMPMGAFSCVDSNIIINERLREIDQQWATGEFKKIILVGHSTGGLYARKIYIAACGENDLVKFEPALNAKEPRPWAKHVDRIVLLAGINMGWSVPVHISVKDTILIKLGLFIGAVMALFGFHALGLKTRRGSSFITLLRMQWLEMLLQAEHKGIGNALAVQLLGTVDDIVSPDDNVDLITGSSFVYLDVPDSGHASVIQMGNSDSGKARRKVFKDSIIKSKDELQAMQVMQADDIALPVDKSVTDVIFVIHGIRDTGFWTAKIARKVKSVGLKQIPKRVFATETSTYGYFPMLPFLLPNIRLKKVEWLMSQYVKNYALYPNAKFSYIGHSNGTYLLAKAFHEYPFCKFHNVIFAGSVVHQNYGWGELLADKRVDNVYNFVANDDWVVGTVPKTLQTLRLQDLGSAGFDGFRGLAPNEQAEYIQGNHGAALSEIYWDDMANFIVNSSFAKGGAIKIVTRSRLMSIVSKTAPLLLLLVICLIFLLGAGIWHAFPKLDMGFKIIFLTLYCYIVWRILTRF